MRTIIGFLFILIAGWFTHQLLPEWTIAIVGGIAGLFCFKKATSGFFLGFLAAALLWGLYAGYLHLENGGHLGNRMGELFGGMDGWLLVLVTALIGGLIGGLGAMTGSLGAAFYRKNDSVLTE